jgi:hypothetical protein
VKSSAVLFIASLACSLLAFAAGNPKPGVAKPPSDAATMELKLRRVEANGRLANPVSAPTIITEPEVNSYLASGKVKLPPGVQSVKLHGEPGIITGEARVDFDRIREGTHSSNPLLSIFSGVHDIVVVAHANGSGGKGYVNVDSVSLDGVAIPEFVLELFVEKFIQPGHPQIGLDSQFALPDRIDTAAVGLHQLDVTQK